MTTRYEVVEAETKEEALVKSRWQKGALARCIGVEAVANGNGTYSVFPICEPEGPREIPGVEDPRIWRMRELIKRTEDA